MRSDPIREELVLHTPTLRLAARAWGPADGAPALALHGWLDNAASFDALAPLLPGLRLVALDLPGHGHSQHRPSGDRYHLVDFVADVAAAIDALGWSQLVLIGHSLGAAIATLLAAAQPERVARLVLIDGIGPHTEPGSALPARLRRSMAQFARPANDRAPSVHATREQAAAARARAGALGQAAARMLTARGTRDIDGGVTWRSDPALTRASPIYLTEEQVLGCLAAIEAPVLLVAGADGHLQHSPALAARCAAVQRLHRADLPGGHHLHLEHPAAVATTVADFLDASAPPPP